MIVAAIAASLADHEDAETLARAGLPTVSVGVTRPGGLDAAMVEQALVALAHVSPSLVLIERPGSLAPPPPLGESAKVVVVSAAGAQCLPAHYAAAFAACDAVVVNMMDLVALTDFRVTEFERRLRAINPHADLLPLSCRTGEGVDQWLRYLESVMAESRQKR